MSSQGSVINFVEPRVVFGLEPQDNEAKIAEALRVMHAIEAVYHQYREKVNADKETGPWEFQNELVYGKFDIIFEPCLTDFAALYNATCAV